VIFALDIDVNPLCGGLDQQICETISLCSAKNVPVVHANSKKRLGMAFTGKLGPKVTVVSVIDFQSQKDKFVDLLELVGKFRFQ
jgi:ribosomal protein L7Ae-like RNA K-turn-binding protein